MAQLTIPAGGAGISVTAADVAVTPRGDLEQHPITVVTPAAATTVKVTEVSNGYIEVTASGTVTVSRP